MPTTGHVYTDPKTGIEITYTTDDGGTGPSDIKIAEVKKALMDLPEAVKKILADTGFKKINIGPINDFRARKGLPPDTNLNGWTPDCPLYCARP